MADAYVFQAALLCSDCARAVMAQTPPPEGVDPANPDECLYDSSDYPKGPYPDGGGEADSPQHCDQCGTFLENPLTADGYAYLREQAAPFLAPDDSEPNPELMADRAQQDWDVRLADLPPTHPARRDPLAEAPLAQWLRFYPEAYEPDNDYEG